MALAKTEASGGSGLDPEVLKFSSSLALDRRLLEEDLLGSLAHVTMLGATGIIPGADATAIRDGLIAIRDAHRAGTLSLPDEEDVHMAVEVELTRTIGAPAALLHSARSRNDQVATDLRLHVREIAATALDALAGLVMDLVHRARAEVDVILPAYTHRQRAQPVSAAYWLGSYAAAFTRDLEALELVLRQVDVLPLGVGAVSGTSLPVDRELTRRLLGFSRVTLNGMDTVGDRDFALDFMYATARILTHASRLATDVVDYTTQEFGFLTLSGDIAMGSSMMPHKRNPDLFELIRGKTGRAVGNLMALFTTVKGLPGGYNRDLQEDRGPLLETGPLLLSVLRMLRLGLSRVSFDRERCLAGLAPGFTQATDLAEALVKKGVPFRTAYQLAGSLVRRCQERHIGLSDITPEEAARVDPAFDAGVLAVLDAAGAVARKNSAGGTGPEAVAASLATLEAAAIRSRELAAAVPRLEALYEALREAAR